MLFIFSAFITNAQTTFDERARVAVGAGGTLAFQNIGGYNGRLYIQPSPKWKMAFCATELIRFDPTTFNKIHEKHYDLNVLHAWKDYNFTDVFYFFEGINFDQWNRSATPKYNFRTITFKENSMHSVRLVPALNIGAGIEKHFWYMGVYAEAKLCIGSVDWITVAFGLKSNLGRWFKDPKKRYDLNLDEVDMQ